MGLRVLDYQDQDDEISGLAGSDSSWLRASRCQALRVWGFRVLALLQARLAVQDQELRIRRLKVFCRVFWLLEFWA